MAHARLPLLALGLVISLIASCAEERPLTEDARQCVSWKDEIAPLVQERCSSCHSGAQPAGKYDTTTYLGVLGSGSDDVSNAIAGDTTSLLLGATATGNTIAAHAGLENVTPKLREWVADCRLSYVRSSVHSGGLLDRTQPDFHGTLLRNQSYDFKSCQSCHGEDFRGGKAEASCVSCHQGGPTSCDTCHGRSLTRSGAHGAHLGAGASAKVLTCSECHTMPKSYLDPGHIFTADGKLDPPPAEVTLGQTAATTPRPADRKGAPAYDRTTGTCSNVYCHGAAFADTKATNTTPTWKTTGTKPSECGTCHGAPPNGRIAGACSSCHPAVVDRTMKVIRPELHIDGKVDLAAPEAACGGCHGTPASPAPPPDLSGNMALDAIGVGAHRQHLTGPARLMSTIGCADCHVTPTELTSPGHIAPGHVAGADDLPAEVFPAGGRFASASAQGSKPTWVPAEKTCANVYCHEGGPWLARDSAPVSRRPSWIAPKEISCGTSCHATPPKDEIHVPARQFTACAACHGGTIDSNGNILLIGPPGAQTSKHINGIIDVGP